MPINSALNLDITPFPNIGVDNPELYEEYKRVHDSLYILQDYISRSTNRSELTEEEKRQYWQQGNIQPGVAGLSKIYLTFAQACEKGHILTVNSSGQAIRANPINGNAAFPFATINVGTINKAIGICNTDSVAIGEAGEIVTFGIVPYTRAVLVPGRPYAVAANGELVQSYPYNREETTTTGDGYVICGIAISANSFLFMPSTYDMNQNDYFF